MTRPSVPHSSAETKAKALVLNHMLATRRVTRETIVAAEFVLGKSGSRADLAVFGTELIGIEIKTAQDNLKRLPGQLLAYRRHCHRTILAIAPKHLPGTMSLAEPDVEVWLLLDDNTVRELTSPPLTNYSAEIFRLLTLEEKKKVARAVRVGGHDIGRLALDHLGTRYATSSAEFWAQVGRGRVKATSMECLSRFRPLRQAQAEWEAAQQRQWRAWHDDAQAFFGVSA